jgi:hypothetical protein
MFTRALHWAITTKYLPPHFISLWSVLILSSHFHLCLHLSSGLLPSFWLSHQNPICITPLRHACYIPCPSHPPRLRHSNYTWPRVQVTKFLIMHFPKPPITPPLLQSNILLNNLTLCSPLYVRHQASHPHTIMGKIIVLYILNLHFQRTDKNTEGSGKTSSKHCPNSMSS